jgi:hypothetical protein
MVYGLSAENRGKAEDQKGHDRKGTKESPLANDHSSARGLHNQYGSGELARSSN